MELRDGQTVGEGKDLLGMLPAGTMLHGYELLSVLGHGGFGITYLARHVSLGREVAIKEYLPRDLALRHGPVSVLPRSTELAGDFNWVRERFLDEARNLVKLEGVPGIVRVIDLFEANGTAYTVMALARGDTLERRLERNGRLPPPAVDRLLWPLLDGLERVHALGFVHRDIKPANIILDDDDRPTLIDFGAARMAMAGRTVATMTAMYTPAYAAPEQVAATRQGPWTDIYGLSATLYHAIAGNRPPSAMERTLDDSHEALATVAPPGFAPALLAGIDAGLKVRPADRPQSIAAWRELLRRAEAKGGDTVVVVKPAPTPPPAPPPAVTVRKRRSAASIGIAAAVVLLAASGYVGLSMLGDASESDRRAAAAEKQRLEDAAKADQLQRQKAEQARREAEAAAAETQRLQEEARRQAEADQVWLEAEAAEKQRLQEEAGEAERLARLKAEEVRRAADVAEQRRLQEDAQYREEIREEETRREEAEHRRVDDLMARLNAEAEMKKAAAADAARKRDAEDGEAALHLTDGDRRRLQVALTFLGFGTGGSDGQFGPLTRQAIASWQKKHGAAATGFLTAAQRQSLLKEGATGIANAENVARRMADQGPTEVAPEPVEKPKPPNVPDIPKPGPVKPPRPPPIWLSPGL